MITIQSNNITQTYDEINALFSLGIQNAEYLHTYHGTSDHFSTYEFNKDAADWHKGITRIMDQYDDVLQELATL
jgi:coproporphyrinogen III oxidase